ncbi:MAG: NUDIX domain-containing protein [Patescibacteria group bacterium]
MWEIVYKGNLIAVEKHAEKGFERAVRPPGVRLILQNSESEILLTKEFRPEQGKVDYRLPGGKVFDDLESYLNVRDDEQKLAAAVMKAAVLEAKQEAGVDEIKNLEIVARSVAGASIEWDLYYLVGTISAMSEQELDGDEKHHGIAVDFYTEDQVLTMLRSGEVSEDRTAGVLFRYLSSM